MNRLSTTLTVLLAALGLAALAAADTPAPVASPAAVAAPAASATLASAPPPTSTGGVDTSPNDPAVVKHGARVFKNNCASCHGATGQGDGTAAATIIPKPRNFTKDPLKYGESPDQIAHTVTEGIANTQMAAWKATLNEKAIRAVAAFVHQIRLDTYNKLSATATAG